MEQKVVWNTCNQVSSITSCLSVVLICELSVTHPLIGTYGTTHTPIPHSNNVNQNCVTYSRKHVRLSLTDVAKRITQRVSTSRLLLPLRDVTFACVFFSVCGVSNNDHLSFLLFVLHSSLAIFFLHLYTPGDFWAHC